MECRPTDLTTLFQEAAGRVEAEPAAQSAMSE